MIEEGFLSRKHAPLSCCRDLRREGDGPWTGRSAYKPTFGRELGGSSSSSDFPLPPSPLLLPTFSSSWAQLHIPNCLSDRGKAPFFFLLKKIGGKLVSASLMKFLFIWRSLYSVPPLAESLFNAGQAKHQGRQEPSWPWGGTILGEQEKKLSPALFLIPLLLHQ